MRTYFEVAYIDDFHRQIITYVSTPNEVKFLKNNYTVLYVENATRATEV